MKPTRPYCQYIISILNEEKDTKKTYARLSGMSRKFRDPFLKGCADLFKQKTFSKTKGYVKFSEAVKVFEKLIHDLKDEKGLCQYLDTTVLFDLFKTEQRKTEIRAALFQCRATMCWYSYLEFYRIFGNAMKILYNRLMRDPTVKSWKDLRGIASDYPTHAGCVENFQSICLLIENLLSDHLNDDPRLFRMTLKNFITEGLELRIRDVVADNIIKDGVMCRKILELDVNSRYDVRKPTLSQKGEFDLLSCRKENADCDMEKFIGRNNTKLTTILNHLKPLTTTDEQIERMSKVLREALDDGEIPKGQQRCWKIGDIIIYLAAPEHYFIRTSNIKHFGPISDAVGKRDRLLKL